MPKILKRSLALFLALMMCFSLVPASAFAVEDEAAVNQAEETVLPEENQPEELPDAAEQLPAPEESPAPEEGGEEAEKAPEQEEAPVTEETPEEPEAPAPAFETVKVCFVCEAPVDLSGLTVYGSGGAVLEPYYDGDSSEASFGVYYLAPGEYTYSFHDETGVYADAENIAFTVSSAEAEQTVEIVLTEAEEEPLPGVEVHSFTYINPLYEDVVDESDIPEVEFTQEDYDEFTALIEGEAKSPKASAANGMHLFAAFNAGAGEIIHTSVADAAAELRPYLAAREPSITIAISSPEEVDYRAFAIEILNSAAIHTGNPTEGDYLSFQYGGYGGNVSISQKGSDYIYRFTYEPLYYTTAAQEDLMTLKVNSVLSGLNLSGKTEYQKIRAIYGYLCDNVKYDYANLRDDNYKLKYTGYAALVNGTAVCQGYSVAFYRLCLTAGIDARIISSVKMNHAWNIAKYVNNYYELDSTWDEGKTFDNYLYFLRGSTYWISSHKYKGVSTIGDEFSNSAFKAAYNLSSSDAPKYYTVSYNANGGTGAPGQQDKQKGKSIRLSTIVPTRPHSDFLGWATTDDATDAEYRSGDTFSTDADTTLYAVWETSYIVPDGTCGDGLLWTLEKGGWLTVYGSGAMPDYPSSADTPWHDYSGLIKSVIIDDGVTKIGKYAFRDCGSLTSVIIPASVTSIGTGAFRACGALTSISVVSSNTAYSSAGNCLIEIASGKLIRGCNNSVIPAEGVTSIGDFSFDGCTGLKSITIPSTVTAIGTNAFYNCSSLTSISIPAGVKSIGTYAFLGCTALTSITVESGNTAYSGAGNCLIGKDSHTLISGCNNSVIPAEGITSISDYAFYGCSGLAGATIPEGVTSIGMQAFRGCSSLASITLPESLTSIGEYAFIGCSKLASVCFNGTASQEKALRSGTASGNEKLLSIEWVTLLKDKGTCGKNLSWVLDTNGVLTISGTGAMADYGSPSDTPWYSYRDLIESAIIENGVTTIGSNAFWGCTELSSITILASVTSIGEYAFAHSSLASITLPESLTSIGGFAFNGCTGLTSITIPDSVTSVSRNAFEGCSALTSITVESGNTVYSGDGNCLIEIASGKLIRGCNNSVIPAEGVTSIGDFSFDGCTGLKSITIPSTVTTIGDGAFHGCMGLTSVTIPVSVTSIGTYAFLGCTALTSISVACGNTVYSGDGNCLIEKDSGTLILGCKNSVIPEGVKSIGDYAFQDCTGLTNITIPASVTSIGDYAFEGCIGLTSVFFNGTVAQEADLRDCTEGGNDILLSIKWVILKDKGTCGDNVSWKLDTNGVLTISGTGAMADYDFSKTPWYSYGDLIKSVIIKNGVTSIGEGAFWNCAGLSSITLPSSVTTIGFSAFNGCTGLTSITVPYGVTSIGGFAFTSCSNLTSITLPSSVTTIGGNAFNGCKRLTSITLPEGLATIGDGAFHGCMGLTSITIPSSVTTIGSGVLRECGTLISISVASGNTKYSGDGNCLIEKGSETLILGCKNSVIPEGVKSIGKSAFSGCTGLTSITIPSSVETIGSSAFERCSNLTSITVPSSVTSIGSQAFYSCSKLADVFYKGRYDEWRIISIAAGNDCLTRAKKHYSVADFGECGENLSWVLDTNGVLTISGSGAMTAYSSQSPAPWSSYINSITSFVIEEGVTTIGTYAFYGCTGLTSVTIPGSVTSVGYAAFYGCSGLMNVYYDGTPLDWKKISIGSSNGYLKLANVICSIPFAETVAISHDSLDITDKTVDADIYRVQTYQLTATAAPDNAKQQFTWASDSTGVASVNKSGLVRFRSPGTATVTATAADGSHTGASVTFNVFYYDAAAEFTASTDAPSTGLEVNYSAQISVFGKDKTAALDPSMFEYTLSNVKNGPFIEVSDAGEITGIKPGGTTTVTAALINDPLGRTVTVSVKTVPTRTKELHIKPLDTEVIRTDDDYEDGFYAIDCNGEITSYPDRFVSYALFLNKLPKGSQKAFPLVIDATDFSDRPIPLPNTDYTWTSSNTKIATVAKDGTVTIKANVDGACTITATSKDLAKAQGTIAVYVMDKTPRLDAAKVTLDVQKTNEVTVGLVSSYGAQILDETDVVFQEYDSKARTYADSTRIEIAGYNSENGLLTLKASDLLNNQTIKGQLVVTTKYRTEPYELPFNVVIKNSAPSVTVKQPSKLNLFYTDIGNTPVDLNVSVKNEQITSIEFEAEDFTGYDNGNGTVTVKLKEHSSTPATKATLTIHLAGYTYPIEKTITVGTVTTKPKLTVTPASAVINTLLGGRESVFAVYNNATGDYITVADMGISAAATEWASLGGEGTNAVLTLTGTTGGKAAISVWESNWASPITVYHTVNVKATNPVAKLGTGTLTLNSNFLNIAETTLTLDQANVSITGINKDLTVVPKGVDKDVAEDWFKVAYTDGRITAKFSDAGETAIGSGALKTGTYSFSITPYVEGVNLNPVTLKISVKNTIPTVTASAVTLNKRLNETGVSTLKLSAKGYTVTGIDGLNSSPNLGIEYADGVLKVWLTDTAKALKAQTFNVTLTPTVRMDEYDTPAAAKPFTLKVSMIDKAPSASVSASGKIDVIVKRSSITYTLTKLNNAVGKVTGFELDGANADLFTLEELEPNSKGQPRYMLTLKDDAVCAANVTYKIKLRFTLDREDGDVIYTPVLNVKPIRSALKLTAAPAAQIFYQSQSRDRVVTYTVKLTSPAGVNIKSVNVGNVSFWQKALADNAENISINISGDTATVKVTLKDTSKLNSGKSYTLPLEVSAEGYPGNISSAKLNLTLKVMK